MSEGKQAAESKSVNLVVDERDVRKGELKAIGGSGFDDFNSMVANQAARSLWLEGLDDEGKNKERIATVGAMVGIKPKSELEGMMAAQLVAAHHAVMECYRRAMIPGQTFEGRSQNLNQANKLSRTWTTLLGALDKHRGKGQQKVTVEHVHVHEGGQAVVGTVEATGGRGECKFKERGHAKQVAHAPEPPMRCANPEGDAMPVASNEEREMPDARRKVDGCP